MGITRCSFTCFISSSRSQWSEVIQTQCRIMISQVITKNPVLQIEQGDLSKQSKFKHVHLKTLRVSMLSRLEIEQGNLVKIQLQYKTTLKIIMRPKRSTLTVS